MIPSLVGLVLASVGIITMTVAVHERDTWKPTARYVELGHVWWARVLRDGQGAAGHGPTRRAAIADAKEQWLRSEVTQ